MLAASRMRVVGPQTSLRAASRVVRRAHHSEEKKGPGTGEPGPLAPPTIKPAGNPLGGGAG